MTSQLSFIYYCRYIIYDKAKVYFVPISDMMKIVFTAPANVCLDNRYATANLLPKKNNNDNALLVNSFTKGALEYFLQGNNFVEVMESILETMVSEDEEMGE